MANNGTWLERAILIAGYTLVLGLGYIGYMNINSNIHEVKTMAEARAKVVDDKFDKALLRDDEHKLAITQLQIFITMNYEERMKALEKLEKIRTIK